MPALNLTRAEPENEEPENEEPENEEPKNEEPENEGSHGGLPLRT